MNKKPEIVDGKIKCEICGKWLRKLSGHVRMHNLKPDDYRSKFGYSLGTSIDTVVMKGGSGLTAQFNYEKITSQRKMERERRAFYKKNNKYGLDNI